MKRTLSLFACVAGLAASQFALAADPQQLAQSKNCLTCHQIAVKVVGPAYKDVAAKYAKTKGAEDALVQKVLNGSQGTWGAGSVMPPNKPNVTEAEAHILVKWVLSQK